MITAIMSLEKGEGGNGKIEIKLRRQLVACHRQESACYGSLAILHAIYWEQKLSVRLLVILKASKLDWYAS